MSIDDVDLWIGGLVEFYVEGGIVGEIFVCIIVFQYCVLCDGDWFWYENVNMVLYQLKDRINLLI